MNAIQRRFRMVIERLGEVLTVAGSDRKGIVSTISSSRAAVWLTSAEVEACVRPIQLAYVPFDDTTTANQAVVWDGRTYTVKKVVNARHRNQIIAKMLILA